MDRFELYECCVQSPRHVVGFLRAAHGEEPLVLREDFCGTAAVSRRWAADGQKRGDDSRALGVDLDGAALARAREMAVVGATRHVRCRAISHARSSRVGQACERR